LIEQSIIGSCLVHPNLVDELDIPSGAFTGVYRKVWDCLKKGDTDPNIIADKVGCHDLLHQAMDAFVSEQSAIECAEELKSQYNKMIASNALILAAKRVSVGEDIDSVISSLSKITGGSEYEVTNIADIVDEIADDIANRKHATHSSTILTGFSNLDNITGGLERGYLVVIAGRPSMGKSALALNMAANMAPRARIGFFSLEMDKKLVAYRIVSYMSGTELRKLRLSKFEDDSGLRDFRISQEAISRLKLFTMDKPAMKMSDIRSVSRRQQAKHGLDCIFIDYVGLMTPEDKKLDKRHQVGDITKLAKQTARELNIPVVLLAQLNREAEGKTPIMSMLKESGSLEEDADLILFPYRDNDYASIIIGKNRNGPTGKVSVRWIDKTASYK